MKRLFLVLSMAVLACAAVFGQSITFQPYLTFDWDLVYYDPVTGLTAANARAFNFDQAGLKVTATVDKISAYAEVRGFPSGSNQYNEYDGTSAGQVSSYTKPIYYAWGKYQFTQNGNIWAGKFKPSFGPILFDSSHFGMGWQQKFAAGEGSHTLSGFVFQPGFVLNVYAPMDWMAKTIPAHEGIRLLLLDELFFKTFTLFGGAAYDYLGENYSKLYFNAFCAWTGVPKLTLSFEAALAVYLKENGIIKDTANPNDVDNAGIGFGLYAAAEYKIIAPVSVGVSLKLVDPLAGAKQNMPMNGKDRTAIAEGEFNTATLALFTKFAPVRDFYIQPQVQVKFANALNGVDPSDSDGNNVGLDFSLTFRWEPRVRLSQ
jgi:hypothetical protein